MPNASVRLVIDVRLGARMGRVVRAADRVYLATLSPEERAKVLARRAYQRRIHAPRSPLSSKHRAGSRANQHRRTVPSFATDRRR